MDGRRRMNLGPHLTDEVRDAVAAVDDPELPGISIVDLGLVESVEVDASGQVTIGLIPSFSGCPALGVIAEDVRSSVGNVEGVTNVDVTFLSAPPWTVERVSNRAESMLADLLGIAVERGGAATCPRCAAVTIERSMFGPTRCRAIHHCPNCAEVVEVIR